MSAHGNPVGKQMRQEPLDDGGPVYRCLPPLGSDVTSAAGYPYVSAGITLRDYFAAQALVALAHDKDFMPLRDADVCYDIADAMLKARKS